MLYLQLLFKLNEIILQENCEDKLPISTFSRKNNLVPNQFYKSEIFTEQTTSNITFCT